MTRQKGMGTVNTALWIMFSFWLLLSHQLGAKHFFPGTPDGLILDIMLANSNFEDDVIDLGGNTFAFENSNNNTDNNGLNGLPAIMPDGGHELKIKNGTITRSPTSITEFRFFYVQAGAFLVLDKVTLENGMVAVMSVGGGPLAVNGGSILNLGTLELIDSTIIGNLPGVNSSNDAASGGGLYNNTGAVATIKGTTFSACIALQRGGAIFNLGSLEEIATTRFINNIARSDGGGIYNQTSGTITKITMSIFDRNTAGRGVNGNAGAVFNNDGATINAISYTTFSFNQADITGGALANYGFISTLLANTFSNNQAAIVGGGAVINSGEIGAITNCTLSSNSVPADAGVGGGILQFEPGTIGALTNSTITLNSARSKGGGIFNDGVILNFISAIVAKNTALSSPDIFEAPGGQIGGQISFNLIGDGGDSNAGNVCGIFLPANDNIVGDCGAIVTVIDPLLESLANNGGPTLTHALRPLSPAIDNGINPAPRVLKFDQRGPGHPRTINGATDIGAYETCEDFDLDGDCDDGQCLCDDGHHNSEENNQGSMIGGENDQI